MSFKLREVLWYHIVLDCGIKDALRVGMVISGTRHLALGWELLAIKNLLTAVRTSILRQKSRYLLDPKLIYKQRKYSTPSNLTTSATSPTGRCKQCHFDSVCSYSAIPLPPPLQYMLVKEGIE